jgi:(5-formylfuran-3-yl)methyl phosphate synthase
MTKLLISVRSAAEAQIALDEGADLIDVKEPLRGSLGAADPDMIAAVVRQVAGRLPVSVALGELLSERFFPRRMAEGVCYAKFGLAGCATRPDWPSRWRQAIEELPRSTAPVAVAYVDSKTASAPDPWRVLAHAVELRCAAVLLDTYDKSRGSLCDHFARADLERYIAAAHIGGLLCVVAGSLGWSEIRQLLPLGPDYVAVRGAACAGNRNGPLDRARVRRLVAIVRRSDPQAALVQQRLGPGVR